MRSTVGATNNEELITNIRDYHESKYLTTITNGGTQLYKKMVELKVFPLEAYYKKGFNGKPTLFQGYSGNV